MKSFVLPSILAICGFSVSVQAGEYLVERRASAAFSTLSVPEDVKVLRSFQAFGKTYDVVEANSAGVFSKVSVLSFARQAWKRVEPNHVYHLFGGSKPPSKPDDLADFDPKPLLPNDSLFNSLWGLLNYGQTVVSKGQRHMDAAVAQAWTLHQGSRRVTVAVMDTGVDETHPDLRANLWTGTENGKTIYGYDAYDQDFEPKDGVGHGTHVSGTIGAVGNNGMGVAGVNWQARIVNVQIFNSKGSTTTDAILRGLDWIYKHRDEVRAVNHSWGGSGYSQALFEAFKVLDDEGIINVMAAGNDSKLLKESEVGKSGTATYPAMYPLTNSIVVASFSNNGKRSSFSNYGPEIVDIAAPGSDITSTVPGGKYASYSGTSMATPHVTGAVALLMSYRPDLSPRQVKDSILSYADPTPALTSTSEKGRRLNAYRALEGR
jgi:serine protease